MLFPAGTGPPIAEPGPRFSLAGFFCSLGPCRPISFAIILFAFQAAGEGGSTQNLTCNPGSSLALCLRPPGGDHSSTATTHVLLWSASKRKGLALWVPEGHLYVVSPSHAGRFALAGNSSFQFHNLKVGDQGRYEVLVRTPGGPNKALLRERTWYSFDINITTAQLAQDSCTLSLDCEPLLSPFRTAGCFLLGYPMAKAFLISPPLFFLYLYLFRRNGSQQKNFHLESLPMGPTVSPPVDPTESSPRDPDF